MIRTRVLLMATLLALCSTNAFGVGAGRLELRSALNQNFSADIALIGVEGMAPEEVLPNLASQEDFDRFGVERSYQLQDLSFRIRSRSDGDLYVAVTSSRPVQEPFLNFIVELRWPSGRVVKEYTVLLDPPVFGEQGTAPIAPSVSASDVGTTLRPSVPQPEMPQPTAARAAPMSEGEVVEGEYGVTGPGDTLWRISLKVRPSESVTLQQTMLALERLNPDAFIGGNINLLKAGHVLRIPDLGEIRETTSADAVSEVRLQNQEFEDYRSSGVAQLDATRRSRSDATPDTDARVEDLENELAVSREDLDRARRANSELNARMDDLSGQIETLNEIVKLKDDQLAAWKAELQKMQEGEGATPAPVEPSAPPTATDQGSLLTNPLVFGPLTVLIVGGLAAGMFFVRKRKADAALPEQDFDDVVLDESADELEVADEEEDEPEDDAEGEVDEDISQQTDDPISEAEIYIAYGRFPQAIEFLQNAIESDPSRADVQLKLLEVYVQTEDATAFNLQFEQLKGLNDDTAIEAATALQRQIPGAAETAEAAMDATIISTEPIAAIADPDDDDDDLSFDLDDLDAETDDEELDLGEELELDLDLGDDETTDLDDTLTLDADDLDLADDGDEISVDLDSGDEISLDLDDDDDLNLDLGDDDEISLDLDDDELSLDLGDDDEISLDLDEDASSKLDLARAYIDMGDGDGARTLLNEVLSEGDESDIQAANELLEKLD